jgi:hypothetical protein
MEARCPTARRATAANCWVSPVSLAGLANPVMMANWVDWAYPASLALTVNCWAGSALTANCLALMACLVAMKRVAMKKAAGYSSCRQQD